MNLNLMEKHLNLCPVDEICQISEDSWDEFGDESYKNNQFYCWEKSLNFPEFYK